MYNSSKPDDLNNYFEPKVCSQCIHFYNPRSCGKKCDERGSTEMRLCSQQYWCDADTDRCDTDFEEISDKKEQIRNHITIINEVIRPDEQKEIPYLYIGLLQNFDQGPQEISSIKTNYRRVEMMPIDWEYFEKRSNGRIRIFGLNTDGTNSFNTAVNGVDITFNIAKTDWGYAEYFGIYDSLVGGNLIVAGKLTKPRHVTTTDIASIFVGNLEINLSYLQR